MCCSKQCCYLHTSNGVKYPQGRMLPGYSPGCANHKSDNFSCCLVHFSDLHCQVLVSLYFHLLGLHNVLTLRYHKIYQHDCSCSQMWYQGDCFPSVCWSRWLYPTRALLAYSDGSECSYHFSVHSRPYFLHSSQYILKMTLWYNLYSS